MKKIYGNIISITELREEMRELETRMQDIRIIRKEYLPTKTEAESPVAVKILEEKNHSYWDTG